MLTDALTEDTSEVASSVQRRRRVSLRSPRTVEISGLTCFEVSGFGKLGNLGESYPQRHDNAELWLQRCSPKRHPTGIDEKLQVRDFVVRSNDTSMESSVDGRLIQPAQSTQAVVANQRGS